MRQNAAPCYLATRIHNKTAQRRKARWRRQRSTALRAHQRSAPRSLLPYLRSAPQAASRTSRDHCARRRAAALRDPAHIRNSRAEIEAATASAQPHKHRAGGRSCRNSRSPLRRRHAQKRSVPESGTRKHRRARRARGKRGSVCSNAANPKASLCARCAPLLQSAAPRRRSRAVAACSRAVGALQGSAAQRTRSVASMFAPRSSSSLTHAT